VGKYLESLSGGAQRGPRRQGDHLDADGGQLGTQTGDGPGQQPHWFGQGVVCHSGRPGHNALQPTYITLLASTTTSLTLGFTLSTTSAIPGMTVHQHGETEWTLLFDLGLADAAFSIVKPRRRRRW
jgi:hypothetical protein